MLATAKIHILKQFTTSCLSLLRIWHCACYCKDTHFEAIHNYILILSLSSYIVLATAKIHILKQFTTAIVPDRDTHGLCLLLQRYTFWSNSQLSVKGIEKAVDCACYCKDTHFEAIHNMVVNGNISQSIVLATAKIHILKQFTTTASLTRYPKQLCLLLQRYTFWSNSQRVQVLSQPPKDCACYCKDTHFEAIHNHYCRHWNRGVIVLATAKIHILKQFTTSPFINNSQPGLCLLLQRYTFWSNSQRERLSKKDL